MNNAKILKKIIAGPNYLSNRMEEMDSNCSFYIDQMVHAKNVLLRKAYGRMAAIYFKRYEYYFKKQTGHGLRESI